MTREQIKEQLTQEEVVKLIKETPATELDNLVAKYGKEILDVIWDTWHLMSTN